MGLCVVDFGCGWGAVCACVSWCVVCVQLRQFVLGLVCVCLSEVVCIEFACVCVCCSVAVQCSCGIC